jgi:hypothetical protein
MSDAYNYGFRRESGYCAIEWSAPNNTQSVNGSTGYFTLSGLATTAALTPADAKVFFIFVLSTRIELINVAVALLVHEPLMLQSRQFLQ